MTTVEKVEQWVIDRNLHTQDPKVQMCKTMEELGELAKAINKGDKEKQMDGIGDTVVTLICIAEQLGLKFNDCLDYAYNEIKDRKGKLINRTFVKESELNYDSTNKKIKTIAAFNRSMKLDKILSTYMQHFATTIA